MEAAIANIYLAVFAFMYFNVQGIYVVSKAKDVAVVLCKERPHENVRFQSVKENYSRAPRLLWMKWNFTETKNVYVYL